ncbi:MAG: hypothetical protein GXP36_12270 [Actinobacteria bacterium]|nr:hypothetical protein [Actinomycetota bacterium]
MKIRLTDNEARIRVSPKEVTALLSKATLVCNVTPDVRIRLRLGDVSTFETSASDWLITIDASTVRDIEGMIGYRMADVAAQSGAPRVVLEIDRPKRWSTSDGSKGGQVSGRFVPASPQESSD